ncbi:mandelate racemase/muconate lactonizing enzyme family protein [Bradyrhizobium sp. AUGA SZCCT0240]|uniref:mandelate racemase/muconate lactonizing enzyme family protein n=1 Tax=unclassified Bradyrhizobium TaxID=2631580 RepID=UPI001BA8EC88|nr:MULTISPECIES: mandelate racemase/muconate lactonizing enzyme family protein [unclassified Bradyrhizobium]MBR1242102.1 mandelate racemase/muconate lactonizing enzyme family protein [Bradyrhizobium sp. AUGA SZCCT0274]MBR1253888.1 mandelate racemase/muconate lactonizing enzyme family protein [Bradyrhizobium sp. AUGA SZCCT0240]
MKITDIRTHILQATLSQPFAYSRAWYDTRTAMLVEIETDGGLIGWGECYGPAAINSAVVKSVAPWLIGEDPLRTDFLWQTVYARLRDHGQKGVVIEGLSGIDIALWDIKGKHFGVPAHQLLGGRVRSEVQAYATGLYRRKSGDPQRYLAEEAAGYVAEGFKAVKLKVGFGVEEDAAVTRAVREAIGPGIALMVDANHAYDATAAIRLGRMIEPHDIGWFEEPVPPEDLAAYREVRSALSIPIAGGECEFTRFGFRDVLVSRAMDIIQPDTCAAGGLSECKKIADMAEAFGIRYNPHVWGTGIAIAASLQLLAVLPTHTPSSLAPLQPMLEFDRTEHPIRQAILKRPIEHERGIVRVPDGPGLGVEVDREALARFAVK